MKTKLLLGIKYNLVCLLTSLSSSKPHRIIINTTSPYYSPSAAGVSRMKRIGQDGETAALPAAEPVLDIVRLLASPKNASISSSIYSDMISQIEDITVDIDCHTPFSIANCNFGLL